MKPSSLRGEPQLAAPSKTAELDHVVSGGEISGNAIGKLGEDIDRNASAEGSELICMARILCACPNADSHWAKERLFNVGMTRHDTF